MTTKPNASQVEYLDGWTVADEFNASEINIKRFGAVADFTYASETGTNNSAAMQAAINAAPEGGVIEIPQGFYRFTQKITSAGKSLTIRGSGAVGTHLIFDDCDGFDINTVYGSNKGWRFEGLTFVSTANGTRTGVKYVGQSGSGSQIDKLLFDDCAWFGADRPLIRAWGSNPNTNTCTWLIGVSLEGADATRFNNCFMTAQERSFSDGWPLATVGIAAHNTTGLTLNNTRLFRFNTGLHLTGDSEGLKMSVFAIVANRRGVMCETVAPSNNHIIVDGHMSSYEVNLKITESSFHTISNIFFLRRSDSGAYIGFKHIDADIAYSEITNCNFAHVATGLNPAGTGSISVDIGANARIVSITNCTFYREATLLNVRAGAGNTLFALNRTVDAPSTLSLPMVVDAGSGTKQLMNTGDRIGPVVSVSNEAVYSAPSQKFLVGSNRNNGLTLTSAGPSAVNYVEIKNAATNQPPTIQAEGDNANVDLLVATKGTGRVRFGTHTASADAAVTGFIEIKDADGTVRKLAVIP